MEIACSFTDTKTNNRDKKDLDPVLNKGLNKDNPTP
jgi:hypothetical protein